MSDSLRSHEPMDRLTEMAGRMIDTLEAEEQFNENIRVIVMLTDEETQMNGTALGGWENDTEAIAFLMENLKVLLKNNGTQVDFVFMNEDGVVRS